MRKMVHNFLWMTASVMMLSVLLVSCTKVKFSEIIPDMESLELDETHQSAISFEVDWRSLGLPDDEMPDDMLVLMSRMQNVTMHYVWYISRYGTIFQPGEETPGDDSFTEGDMTTTPAEASVRSDDVPEEGTPEDETPEDEVPEDGTTEGEPEEVPEEDDNDDAMVYNGLYSVMAVASVDNEDFIVPHLDRFLDSLALRMRDIYIEIPEIDEEVKKEQAYMDFNPFYPFIRTAHPLYFVRSEEDTHQRISSLDDNIIRLSPMLMTRNITFSINAEVEDGVSIDRMVGIISGIPASAQFMSGYVRKQDLCKMPFEMARTAGSQTEYSGSVNVFGLFPSDSPDHITGPGIFNVILHASVEDDNGNVRKRVFHASVNLMETITKADIMVMADDMIHYVLSSREDLTMKIADRLVVTRDKILTGSGQGFEVWQENDTDDDKGLNPEI